MDPLERAARALAKAESGVDEWDAYEEPFKATLRANARATVEAYLGKPI